MSLNHLLNQAIFVSATPDDFELEKTGGVVVEQVVRPTGLLDPPIEIRPSVNQIDDLLDEIDKRVTKGDRVLVTTLTKRMAEEMDKYLHRINIKSKYIHSEVDTLERVEILATITIRRNRCAGWCKPFEGRIGSAGGITWLLYWTQIKKVFCAMKNH